MNKPMKVSLAENIRHLRKQMNLTQEQLAQTIGIKRSLIGAYEEGRAEPKLETLVRLSEALGVSTEHLITTDFTRNDNKPKETSRILAITIDKDGKENIELIPQKAAAGYLNGYSDPEYIQELPKFRLPFLPENATYRAFEITGDSMLPLASGTIIIGKYTDNISEIKNGKTYIILSEKEGIVYKRVFNYLAEKGKLFLVSDNKMYSPYELHPSEILEIWEARAFISIQFPDPEATKELSIEKLSSIVVQLQQEVREIKGNM